MRMKCSSPMSSRSQHGFSLVELMIAITLGLIVVGAIGYLYLGSRQAFRTTDAMSRIQENARYALQTMAHDVRMAGYVGCGNLQTMNVNTIANAPVPALTAANALTGWDAGAGTMSFGSPAIKRISTTDAISIMGAFGGSVTLTGNVTPTNANVQISGNPNNFAVGNLLMVSNCTNADNFWATTVSNSGGTVTLAHATNANTTNWVGTYDTSAIVMKLEQYIYFIGLNPLTNERSLYRNSLSEGTVELADNVWDMQILYGVDNNSDGAADVYQAATTVGNWAQVVSARISLLMVSQDNVLTAPQTYQYFADTGTSLSAMTPAVGAPDRLRLHQVFTATVGVRNRLP